MRCTLQLGISTLIKLTCIGHFFKRRDYTGKNENYFTITLKAKKNDLHMLSAWVGCAVSFGMETAAAAAAVVVAAAAAVVLAVVAAVATEQLGQRFSVPESQWPFAEVAFAVALVLSLV